MRTEEEVIKDFEELGYEIRENKKSNILEFWLIEDDYEDTLVFEIDKDFKTYNTLQGMYVEMKEHKLLNELFSIWGWL